MTRIGKRSTSTRGSRPAMVGSLVFHSLLLLALWRVAALAAAEDEGPARFVSEVVAPTALPTMPPPPPDRPRSLPPEELPDEPLLEEEPAEEPPLFEVVEFTLAPPPSVLAIPTRRFAAARLRPPPVAEERPARAAPPSPARPQSFRVLRGPSRSAREAAGNARPRYPSRAVAQGIEGRVVLLATLDATGRVTDLRVLESSGFALLDREALRAVATWRFLPKLVDGAPVASTLKVPVRFDLR